MSATKHVNRAMRWELSKRGHHDLGVVLVALLFHHRHNAANRVNSEVVLPHGGGGQLPEVVMDAALNRSVQHGITCCIEARFGTPFSFLHRFFDLGAGHVGS